MSIGEALIHMFDHLRNGSEPTPDIVLETLPNGRGRFATVRNERGGYDLRTFDADTVSARRHVFLDLESFAAWLNREAETKRVVPVDVDIALSQAGRAVAILDLRDTDSDRAECPLSLHPRFARWFPHSTPTGGDDTRVMTQREFHRLIVTSPDDFDQAEDRNGKPIGSYGDTLAGQVAKLGVKKGQEVSAELDERGNIRFISASEKMDVSGTLPPKFRLHLPVFRGLEQTYPIEVHIDLDTSQDLPRFRLDAPALDLVFAAALADALEHLRGLLKPEFLVGLGELKTATHVGTC